MPKDFKKHFTKDLGKAVVRGRKEFAKRKLDSIKDSSSTDQKRRPDFPNYLIPDPTPRQIKNPRVPNVTLREDLFVGNRAKYAGFAINAPGQTRPNLSGEPVTYEEHGKEGFKLTSTGGPNWYNIYTKGGLINKDIALAFKKVGFR